MLNDFIDKKFVTSFWFTGPAFEYWNDNHEDQLWEHSGLFEGDIMLHREYLRNGLLNEKSTWPDATVPFYIDSQDFSKYCNVRWISNRIKCSVPKHRMS